MITEISGEIKELNTEASAKEATLVKVKIELEKINKDVDSKEREAKALSDEISKSQGFADLFASMMTDASAKAAVSNTESEASAPQQERLNQLNCDIAKLKEKRVASEQEIDKISLEISNLKDKISTLQKKKESIEQAISLLWGQLVTISSITCILGDKPSCSIPTLDLIIRAVKTLIDGEQIGESNAALKEVISVVDLILDTKLSTAAGAIKDRVLDACNKLEEALRDPKGGNRATVPFFGVASCQPNAMLPLEYECY